MRISVSRSLYISALADAIDWQESLLETHDPDGASVISCCRPGARCQQYKDDAARLRRYRQARAAVLGPQQPEPRATTVTLAELRQQAAP